MITQDSKTTWQVCSMDHRATYRPAPQGGWLVHVECGLGRTTSKGDALDVTGAMEFLTSVQGGFGGVMLRRADQQDMVDCE